jgi:membrane fusion protein (multidrug efflux system)
MTVKQILKKRKLPKSLPPPRRFLLLAVGGLAFLGALYAAGRWWNYHRHHATTDDAYVRADITPLSTRVEGTVARVFVKDNASVKAGDVILELDPTDLEVAVRAARARLGEAIAKVRGYHAAVAQARAEVATAEAEAQRARTDYERLKHLERQRVVSRQDLDHARTAFGVAEAKRQAAEKALDEALSLLGGDANQPIEENSLVQEARAALDRAKLDLSYAVLKAPDDGYISQKNVEVGQRVEKGQPLMTLVKLSQPYVLANFKETDLSHVRIGQPVEIKVDIYPDTVYRGHVDSIDSGTGAAFSLLPPENASGNWVKIVQRVPVKVVLDAPPPVSRPLRVGLSAIVSIDTTRRTGPLLVAREARVSPIEALEAHP